MAVPAIGSVITLIAVASLSAGASTSPTKALVKDLLPSSYAKRVGFTNVVERVSTSSKSGVKSCPRGAQVAFEDGADQMGLVSEVLQCRTEAAAAKLLRGVVAETSVSSPPPHRLGSSAIERRSSGPIYTIYWRRGLVVELVALETKLSASSSSSSTTTTATSAPLITADQQKVRSEAAVEQDTRLGRGA